MTRMASLSIGELEKLQLDPRIGDVTRDRIAATLADRKNEPRQAAPVPKSSDPRSRMTKPEVLMAQQLDVRVRLGEVKCWWFEAVSFRVGIERSNYRPDFVALLADGTLEVTEVKGGHIWEDSVKSFKAAVQLYPFARWRLLQLVKGEWRTLHDFAR